jgi:6-phosphogluconate dehydrogenase (decarboxylating)
MQRGMIGLGRMGSNMVRRLVRGGQTCVVHDTRAAALAAPPTSKTASSPLCVPSSAALWRNVSLIDPGPVGRIGACERKVTSWWRTAS